MPNTELQKTTHWKQRVIDALLFLFALGLGVFFFQMVRTNRGLETEVSAQKLQASALIIEVGQVKEENFKLFQKLNTTEKTLESLKNNSLQNAGQIESIGSVPNVIFRSTPLPSASLQKVPRVTILPPPPPRPQTRNFLFVGHNKRLADTVMLAAISQEKNEITLISLPRDLYVNGRKINEYLSLYGIDVLKEKVETVLDLKIEGYFVINFEAFEKIVDALGGIDVYVEKALYDESYPNGRGGYTTYNLSAGSHHLNGVEALKFARSRHSTSDFDRAKRQQQILKSLQERIVNFDFLTNLDQLEQTFEALHGALETNFGFLEAIAYLREYQYFALKSGNVISNGNFLYPSANMGGQYILLPKSGDWSDVQQYVRELL